MHNIIVIIEETIGIRITHYIRRMHYGMKSSNPVSFRDHHEIYLFHGGNLSVPRTTMR